MPLATTTAEARGRTVLAARRLNTAATPAGAMDGMITTGHHIILLPKLAPSCSVKISAAVTSAPAAARPARLRSNRPVRMSMTARAAIAARGARLTSIVWPPQLPLVPGRNSWAFWRIPVLRTPQAFSSPPIKALAMSRICARVACGGMGGTSGSV